MRSLVEVCAEQRAMSWREADEQREARHRRSMAAARKGAGERLRGLRHAKWAAIKARALAMYAEGQTMAAVAEALGISDTTLKDWVRAAGIRGGPKQRADRVDAPRLRHTLRAEGRL